VQEKAKTQSLVESTAYDESSIANTDVKKDEPYSIED
jgi:hypothetical protein